MASEDEYIVEDEFIFEDVDEEVCTNRKTIKLN